MLGIKKLWLQNLLLVVIVFFGAGGMYRNETVYHQPYLYLIHTVPGKTVTILDTQIRTVGKHNALNFYFWVEESTHEKTMVGVSSTAYQLFNSGDSFHMPDKSESDGIWTLGIIGLLILVLDHFIMMLRKYA
jgi:hypothetical protein